MKYFPPFTVLYDGYCNVCTQYKNERIIQSKVKKEEWKICSSKEVFRDMFQKCLEIWVLLSTLLILFFSSIMFGVMLDPH